MSTPITDAEMVEFLGTIDEHDPDLAERPDSVKYMWFSKLLVWQPGMSVHGWSAGVHPSPYPDDEDFVLVVFHCRSVVRMSKLTPLSVLDLIGRLCASLREVDYIENGEFSECDHGAEAMAKQLGDFWREFRSDNSTVSQPQAMTGAGQEFIGALILAFSHEHKPALARSIKMRTVTIVRAAAGRADGDITAFIGDWSAALELAVTEEARSLPTWRGQRGFKGLPFKKVCASIMAGYLDNLSPKFSIHYTMDPIVSKEGIGPLWIGGKTSWSDGLKVPYLDQPKAISEAQKALRDLSWVSIDGRERFLPEDVLRMIDVFAYGTSHALERDQKAAKEEKAKKEKAEIERRNGCGPSKKRRVDDMPSLE